MKRKLSGSGLVILLESGVMAIEAVPLGRRKAKPRKRITVELPSGAVEDGVIRDIEGVTALLRGAIKENRLSAVRKAVFCLCSTQILSEDANVPAAERKWLDKMISTNRDLYFPVNTEEYAIAYTRLGDFVDEDGKPNLRVRVWATPLELLRGYYEVANSCGLSVAAMDYCGNSFVTAAKAVYAAAANKTKRGITLTRAPKQPKTAQVTGAAEEAEPYAEGDTAVATMERPEEAPAKSVTDLYLLAERDFLLLTFIRDGQTVMQRYLRRDGSLAVELDEARLALAVYVSDGNAGEVRATLLGEMSSDGSYGAELSEALDVSVRRLPTDVDADRFLCSGAAMTGIDFGSPEMDKPKRFSFISQAWQYGVFAAGAGILAVSVMAYIFPHSDKQAELDSLQTALRAKQQELTQVSDYASRYTTYRDAYLKYLSDWQSVLGHYEFVKDEEGNVTGRVYIPGVLRHYNDNLRLFLEELEDVLPTNSSVTEIRIENGAAALQIASESKEDVVNLLVDLRYKLTYSTLFPGYITSMTQGQGVSVFDGSISSVIAQILAAGEPAPTEGGVNSGAIGDYWPDDDAALQEALDTLTPDQRAVVEGMIRKGPDAEYTPEEIQTAARVAKSLSSSQRKAIAAAMGWDPNYGYTLSELLQSNPSFDVKKAAMENMMHNPIALYVLGIDMWDDLNSQNSILWDSYKEDFSRLLFGGGIDFSHLTSKDISTLFPFITTTPVQDPAHLNATVALIQTDPELSGYYAYYLAVEMGLQAKTGPGTDPTDPTDPTGPGTTDPTGPGTTEPQPSEPGTTEPQPTNPGGEDPGPGGVSNPLPYTWEKDPETGLPINPTTGKPLDPAHDNDLFSRLLRQQLADTSKEYSEKYHVNIEIDPEDIDWTQIDWYSHSDNMDDYKNSLIQQVAEQWLKKNAGSLIPGGLIPGGEDQPGGSDRDQLVERLKEALSQRGINTDNIDWDALDLSGVDPSNPLTLLPLIQQIMQQSGGLPGGLPGGDPSDPTGPGGEIQEPADTRYYITVILVYNPNMMTTEIPREGLDVDSYVPELQTDRADAVERWTQAGVIREFDTDTPASEILLSGRDLTDMYAALLGRGDADLTADILADFADQIKPDGAVSRELLLATMAKVMGIAPMENGYVEFSDDDSISDFARGYVNAMVDRGIVDGYNGAALGPKEIVTVEEAAMYLDRLVGECITEDGEHAISGLNDRRFTLVTAKDVTPTGPYNGKPIVLYTENGSVDMGGVPGKAHVNVMVPGVTVTNAPAGTRFRTSAIAGGLTVNGVIVGANSEYVVPEDASEDPGPVVGPGSEHTPSEGGFRQRRSQRGEGVLI